MLSRTKIFNNCRYMVQGIFLALYIYLAIRFSLWVSALSIRTDPGFARPAGVDGFLPISGLLNLKHLFLTGQLVPIHPAAALILLAALITAMLLKRGFCSWICPIYLVSEGCWRLGARLFGRTFTPPFWLDLILRSAKYLILGFFVYNVVYGMSSRAIAGFLNSPYHRIADIRMLEFFQSPSMTLLITIALLTVIGIVIQMPWCRYLCPYGALLGILSLLSLGKVTRSESACVRCNRCSDRCPAWLPVMSLKKVRSPECYACYSCINGCPAPGALEFKFGGRWPVRPLLYALLIIGLFVAIDLIGRMTGNWHGTDGWQEIAHLLRRLK